MFNDEASDAAGTPGTNDAASQVSSPDPATTSTSGAGKREVDLYVRTYNTLLRSSGPVTVETLVPAHLNIDSSLHAGARDDLPDMSAFMYSTLRLPASIVRTERILLGQSATTFARAGYPHLESWQPVTAPGRRRRWYDNGSGILAAYVASPSDLDDLVPSIVAWQIEWNKLHAIIDGSDLLQARIAEFLRGAEAGKPNQVAEELIREGLKVSRSDWQRLRLAWGGGGGEGLARNLELVAADKKRLTIQLLGGSYIGYERMTRNWWTPIDGLLREHELIDRPLYFISSNTHSIANILSGTARRRRQKLISFAEKADDPELTLALDDLREENSRSSWDNFLYYTARRYFSSHPEERRQRDREEEERGITTIAPEAGIDVAAQIIEPGKLRRDDFDPRLKALEDLKIDTDAVILNINYPLGLSAYHILTQLGMSTNQLRGAYILGKAATLNARIGDVMLANVVHDEHSGNTFWFRNCFSAADLTPFLVYGAALDHQRAVTVLGTYLQNREYLDFYYRGNYTVVEMEAGPYLNAIFEETFLTRYGQEENVNLTEISLDLGIIHYASDTPYTRAQTLGARGLSYYGMDSTYASTLAILSRLLQHASK